MLSPDEELLKIKKCAEIFENLGWDVSIGKSVMITKEKGYRMDIVLKHNDEVYGFVEVLLSDSMERAKAIKEKIQGVVDLLKPRVFIITNGYVFDTYHYDAFYGTLTVPPAPEFVDILLGGEEDV